MTVTLPRLKGEETTFDACGTTFVVRKVKRDCFCLTCPPKSHRARFGTAEEIQQDIAYALESGSLPKSETSVH